MAKRVKLEGWPQVRLNETSVAILVALARRSGPDGTWAKPLSASEAVSTLGVSKSLFVRYTNQFSDLGLVTVVSRHLANGSQLENAYPLTQLGWRLVDDLRKAKLCPDA